MCITYQIRIQVAYVGWGGVYSDKNKYFPDDLSQKLFFKFRKSGIQLSSSRNLGQWEFRNSTYFSNKVLRYVETLSESNEEEEWSLLN